MCIGAKICRLIGTFQMVSTEVNPIQFLLPNLAHHRTRNAHFSLSSPTRTNLARVQLVKRSSLAGTKKPIALKSAIDCCHSQPTRFGRLGKIRILRLRARAFYKKNPSIPPPLSQSAENEALDLRTFSKFPYPSFFFTPFRALSAPFLTSAESPREAARSAIANYASRSDGTTSPAND